MEEDDRRNRMVRNQLEGRGIHNSRLLEAFRRVPRHEFIPENSQALAYDDRPVPIGNGQTISQPYIVALMIELARPAEGEIFLEVGTGSGYVAALLSLLVDTVYTIERDPELSVRASTVLSTMGYENVVCKEGDGYEGYPAAAPFDAVILSAAPPRVPKTLLSQLREGGRLVAPVGGETQSLVRMVRNGDDYTTTHHGGVRFVPMV